MQKSYQTERMICKILKVAGTRKKITDTNKEEKRWTMHEKNVFQFRPWMAFKFTVQYLSWVISEGHEIKGMITNLGSFRLSIR